MPGRGRLVVGGGHDRIPRGHRPATAPTGAEPVLHARKDGPERRSSHAAALTHRRRTTAKPAAPGVAAGQATCETATCPTTWLTAWATPSPTALADGWGGKHSERSLRVTVRRSTTKARTTSSVSKPGVRPFAASHADIPHQRQLCLDAARRIPKFHQPGGEPCRVRTGGETETETELRLRGEASVAGRAA